MGSPFNTATRAAHIERLAEDNATDAQITRAILPAIERGAWRDSDATKHVERVAVLNTVIGWALNPMDDATPAEVSLAINGTVGRGAPYGQRVNAVLSHLAAKNDAAAHLYKPLTKKGASALIEWLFAQDDAAKTARVAKVTAPDTDARPSADEVPAGRYAVEIENSTVGNDLAFYKVDRPTEGRWAGYVFVKQIVGPEEQAVRGPAAITVLRQIAADAAAASIRYGQAVEKCGVCHTRLTNKASREAGIGPDCRKKYGW